MGIFVFSSLFCHRQDLRLSYIGTGAIQSGQAMQQCGSPAAFPYIVLQGEAYGCFAGLYVVPE